MATIRIDEYSGNGEHGVRVYLSGSKLFDALFTSPGFSSQSAMQQTERYIIDRLSSVCGDDDTIRVNGTLRRPAALREWLTAHGAEFPAPYDPSQAGAALGSIRSERKTANSRETVKIAQDARRTERCTCGRTDGTHRYDCPGYRRERARTARAKSATA